MDLVALMNQQTSNALFTMDAALADDGPTKALPTNAIFDDDDEVEVKPKPVVTT